MKRNRSFRFRIILAAVSAAAFLLRLLVGLQLLAVDSFMRLPPPETDMATYRDLCSSILAGRFPEEFYYQPFYYSIFLPAVQFFSGPSPAMVLTAQALCGALAVWLTGILAAKLFGRKAGILAAAVLAFSRIAVIYSPWMLIETMQSLWLILLLAVTFHAWKKRRLLPWFLCGIVLSFAVLSRGNAWIFVIPVLSACLYSLRKKSLSFRAGAAGLLLSGAILLQIPFSAVNSISAGALRGPSTAGGNVLALGNTPEAPPGTLFYPESYQAWMKFEKERSVPMRMLDWMREEPLGFLELQFRKVFLFWDSREIPNNINPEKVFNRCPILYNLYLIPTGWIFTAALAGIFLSLGSILARGKRRLLTAVMFVVLFCLATAVFYNLARFRVPGIPLICVLVPAPFVILRRNWKSRPRGLVILTGLLAVLAAYAVVYPGFDVYRSVYEPAVMRIARPHGVNSFDQEKNVFVCDNGPLMFGTWVPLSGRSFVKTFSPRVPVAPGTPIQVALTVLRGKGEGGVSVNGMSADVSHILTAGPAPVKIFFRMPYPSDGVFTIRLDSDVLPLADLQRAYGRTFDSSGRPMELELVSELKILRKN